MITQRKSLALAVSAVLGASAGAAQADSAFFPMVVYSPTVTTIVSTINESRDNYDASGGQDDSDEGREEYLHYRLYYKDLLAADVHAEPCEEFNVFRPTSKYDIQTIDLGDVVTTTSIPGTDPNDLGVLFEDPRFDCDQNDWCDKNDTYALGVSTGLAAWRGYLVVDNRDDTTDTESLSGEAVVLEYTNGSAWGYTAFDRQGNDESLDAQARNTGNEFDYGINGEADVTDSPAQVAVMPYAEVNTGFFVTPVYAKFQGEADSANELDEDEFVGNVAPPNANNYEATLKFETGKNGAFALYDRDEGVVSGAREKTVVCVSRVNVESLLTGAAANTFEQRGGWGNLRNYTTVEQDHELGTGEIITVSGRLEPAAVVIKHEAGDSLNGFATGRWNNAMVLPTVEEAKAD
jgi:hypothetical protein